MSATASAENQYATDPELGEVDYGNAESTDHEAPWHRFLRERALVERGGAQATTTASQFHVEVTAPPRHRPGTRGRFENNLSRKGIFELRPDRENPSGAQDYVDVVGKTAVTFTLGMLGPLEMDLIAWTMGRWHADTNVVTFNLREVGRALGVSWNGQLAGEIKDSLRRIKGTTITGRVWDVDAGRHTTTHFGIFDAVQIDEQRAAEDGPATSPATVTVHISEWIAKQLRAGQYSDFDWSTYRQGLPQPFSRRLYLFLESQQGEQDGTLYRVRVDNRLGHSLGTRDAETNMSRFRERLRSAGAEICKANPSYLSIALTRGQGRAEYWLTVKRSRRWHEKKRNERRMGAVWETASA